VRSVQPGEIEVFIGSGVLANHLEKFEGAGVPDSLAQAQRPEFLTDGPVLKAPGYGDEYTRRMTAERRRKVDFLVSGKSGGCGIGGAEMRDELRRKHSDGSPAIRFTRLDDLRQRRTT
jgi:hypothetical protein